MESRRIFLSTNTRLIRHHLFFIILVVVHITPTESNQACLTSDKRSTWSRSKWRSTNSTYQDGSEGGHCIAWEGFYRDCFARVEAQIWPRLRRRKYKKKKKVAPYLIWQCVVYRVESVEEWKSCLAIIPIIMYSYHNIPNHLRCSKHVTLLRPSLSKQWQGVLNTLTLKSKNISDLRLNLSFLLEVSEVEKGALQKRSGGLVDVHQSLVHLRLHSSRQGASTANLIAVAFLRV